MPNITQLRKTIASCLGKVLTPEMAAAIELAAVQDEDKRIDLSGLPVVGYGDLTFSAESLPAIWPELMDLHSEHWRETEAHRHGLALNPDFDRFCEYERKGQMLQLVARTKGGALVGNIRVYLPKSMHTQTLMAVEDTFYLRPEFRSGFNAIRAWQHMEQCVRALGAAEITTDSKLVNRVGRLNEYLGYKHVANKYHKFLGDCHVQQCPS